MHVQILENIMNVLSSLVIKQNVLKATYAHTIYAGQPTLSQPSQVPHSNSIPTSSQQNFDANFAAVFGNTNNSTQGNGNALCVDTEAGSL